MRSRMKNATSTTSPPPPPPTLDVATTDCMPHLSLFFKSAMYVSAILQTSFNVLLAFRSQIPRKLNMRSKYHNEHLLNEHEAGNVVNEIHSKKTIYTSKEKNPPTHSPALPKKTPSY